MNVHHRLTRAAAALPATVRQRLDGAVPVDWQALASPATVRELTGAGPARARLPATVETLVKRLVDEVGIAPAEVAGGLEGTGAAGTWIQWIAVEPDGAGYRLRNERSGELHAAVGREALVGYAVLAMELAAILQQACDAWSAAGELAAARSVRDPGALAEFAAAIALQLKARREAAPEPLTTAAQARLLEDAWNAQSAPVREALASSELVLPAGAHAPRPHYYAVDLGCRLHVFDPGEARWLLALAVHDRRSDDAVGAGRTGHLRPGPTGRPSPPDGGDRDAGPAASDTGPGLADDSLDKALRSALGPAPTPVGLRPEEACGSAVSAAPDTEAPRLAAAPAAPTARRDCDPPAGRPEAATDVPWPLPVAAGRSPTPEARPAGVARLPLGTAREQGSAQVQPIRLAEVASRLPDSLSRRFGATYGAAAARHLARLLAPEGSAELRAGGAVPAWLQTLAAAVFSDAGAQTADGLRTGPLRFSPERQEEGYRVVEVDSSDYGFIRPADLVDQIRLGLEFATDACIAITSLDGAGKEAEWILGDAAARGGQLSGAELAKLEATQWIGQELQRAQRAFAAGSSGQASALEQTVLIARAVESLQVSARASAGWPADVGVPHPRNPADVARTVIVAQALHGNVRQIANRLIAVGMAGEQGESRARVR